MVKMRNKNYSPGGSEDQIASMRSRKDELQSGVEQGWYFSTYGNYQNTKKERKR